MQSAVILGALLVIGVAGALYGAASDQFELHMGLVAGVCLVFAVIAVWEGQRLRSGGASEAALAASTASSMALVWAWASLSLFATYVFVHSWHEWWQYVLGAGVIAALCLFFASALRRDDAAGRVDEAMLKLARYLTIGQLVGMVAAMIGLVLDDKMPRSHDEPDWAASTIFFFGAAALAVISLNGLRGSPSPKS